MSHLLISRSADLSRLQHDGYSVSVRANHLVIEDVPYVDADKAIRVGTFVCPLNLSPDGLTLPPTGQHVVHFAGDFPCDKEGKRLAKIEHGSTRTEIIPGLFVDHSFSSKPPASNGYPNYYDQMVAYIAIVWHPAAAIDPTVTPKRFRPIEAVPEDNSPFKYFDTASSRVGITATTHRLALKRVAIVGLGGTGSYILDLIAKTPIEEIHLFDGDLMLGHNAFRAPGAASIEELRNLPKKVDYFYGRYAPMRNGIVPHPVKISGSKLSELAGMDFVFLCFDGGEDKRAVIEFLEAQQISFIDVGMGLVLGPDGRVSGLLRVTTSTPQLREHVRTRKRIPISDSDEDDLYRQNIQVADLNALNATLAVVRWKKLFGFYQDTENEHFSLYAVGGNCLINEDKP